MESKKYKGIIFDLDGTLVDTLEDLTDSLNVMLEDNHLPTITYAQGMSYIGNGLRKLVQRAVPDYLKQDEAFIDRGLREMKDAYKKRWIYKTRPYPGVEDFLKYCQENKIKLGVSSNKSDDATKFIIANLFPDIDFVEVTGNVPGRPHKPNPEQTDHIIESMKLSPEEILYVGDSITDLRTARNSHLDLVLVDYGYEDQSKFAGENVEMINNFSKLVDKIALTDR